MSNPFPTFNGSGVKPLVKPMFQGMPQQQPAPPPQPSTGFDPIAYIQSLMQLAAQNQQSQGSQMREALSPNHHLGMSGGIIDPTSGKEAGNPFDNGFFQSRDQRIGNEEAAFGKGQSFTQNGVNPQAQQNTIGQMKQAGAYTAPGHFLTEGSPGIPDMPSSAALSPQGGSFMVNPQAPNPWSDANWGNVSVGAAHLPDAPTISDPQMSYRRKPQPFQAPSSFR